jgi:hypothetical protein
LRYVVVAVGEDGGMVSFGAFYTATRAKWFADRLPRKLGGDELVRVAVVALLKSRDYPLSVWGL